MIIRCIKLAVLFLSNFGYWEYFRVKHKINAYFIPFFTISVQFCVLFAAGILNYLKDAVILLSLVGNILLIISLHERKRKVAKPYLNVGFLYLAIMFMVIAVYTNDRQFLQSDNFTHWGTVVRNMLNTDRFPGGQDTVVRFISYPLGSSAMIYYYCQFLGPGEDRMMLAQGFLMLCAMLPVYAFARKHIRVSAAIIAIMTVLLFQYVVPVTELLVDALLPMAGVASAAFTYYHCVMGENDEKRSFYYALPTMIWTMNIKHAALLYVAGTFILLLVDTNIRKQKKTVLNCFLILFAVRSIWSRHCSYINPEARNSQHAMSLNWFSRILADKSKADILNIMQEFWEFVISRRELYWILMFVLVLSLLALVVNRQKKMSIQIAVSILSVYAVYGIGVLGTYIFSMPVEEGLNGIDRYMKSGDVAVYYIILIFAVSILERIEGRCAFAVTGAALIILVGCAWWFQSGKYANISMFNCTVEERQRWEAPIAEYGIEEKRSYLLCVSQEDFLNRYQFPRYIWRYHMYTSSVDQIVVTDEAQLEQEMDYDYVVILDQDNPVIQNWLQNNYPQKVGSQVIQHFT